VLAWLDRYESHLLAATIAGIALWFASLSGLVTVSPRATFGTPTARLSRHARTQAHPDETSMAKAPAIPVPECSAPPPPPPVASASTSASAAPPKPRPRPVIRASVKVTDASATPAPAPAPDPALNERAQRELDAVRRALTESF
jgi:hypothetical protein